MLWMVSGEILSLIGDAQIKEKLKKKNISSKIVKGNKFYLVRKGKSAQKSNLKNTLNKIKKKTNYYPIIIKTNT